MHPSGHGRRTHYGGAGRWPDNAAAPDWRRYFQRRVACKLFLAVADQASERARSARHKSARFLRIRFRDSSAERESERERERERRTKKGSKDGRKEGALVPIERVTSQSLPTRRNSTPRRDGASQSGVREILRRSPDPTSTLCHDWTHSLGRTQDE